MSPSIKQSDQLKNRSLRLTQNSIVISFSKCDNYYMKCSDNSHHRQLEPVLKQLESSHRSSPDTTQWPAANGHSLPTPAIGYDSHGYHSLESSSGGSGGTPTTITGIRCTCAELDGWSLFRDFLSENSMSVWNPYLMSCLTQIQFLGFLQPSSLLIGGTDFSLEVIRSQWSRRVLRAPKGFRIDFIGDISFIDTSIVNQTQFTPLSEALCKCVNELNVRHIRATFGLIVKRLRTEFPNMELPSEKILKNALKTLVQNKKLFYDIHNDCFTATSHSFPVDNNQSLEDLETSLVLRNQHLLTGEEAFQRLYGKPTKYASEGSSHSKKSWPIKHDIIDDQDFHHQRKRDSLISTDRSSIYTHKTNTFLDNESQKHNNSALRRSSSLRLESNKMNGNSSEARISAFKRSRSFKIQRKNHEIFEPHESSGTSTLESGSTSESYKSKSDSIKKQSVLSKFLRLGTSGGNVTKGKPLAQKSANFSAQFPEMNGAMVPYNDITPTKSTATQTVKCGPEDYATVIIKQASRHALAKSGSQTQKQLTNNHNKDNDLTNNWKNVRCHCLDRELTNGKHLKANKSLTKCKYGNKLDNHHSPTTPITSMAAIGPISTPIDDCILCNCNPETHKIDSNGKDLTNNNNNYWSKPNQHFVKQFNGLNGFDYKKSIKPSNDGLSNNCDQRTTTSPLYTRRSSSFRDRRAPVDEPFGNHLKGYPLPTPKYTANPPPNHTTRFNNNSMSLNERPKDNRELNNKNQLFNTCLDSQTDCQNKFTQQFPSNLNQCKDNMYNNGNYCVDNSLNVRLEIGSTATTKFENMDQSKDDNSVTQSHRNTTNTTTKIVSSTNIHSSLDELMDSKHPIVTSATTVTTTMTLPDVYNPNNINNNNDITFDDNILDWIHSPTDSAANGIKSMKLCNNEDNNHKSSNLMNKHNNLLSEIKINSVPHLSPIRQRVAKAKAEFFNSAGPKTPVPVTNLLIEK